jgi:nucleoside-diphosphate-sugar epimerase
MRQTISRSIEWLRNGISSGVSRRSISREHAPSSPTVVSPTAIPRDLSEVSDAIARAKGVSASIGDGHNRWPAAHVTDVARLYRLALDKFTAGARYHAVAEEGVPLKDIATVIGHCLNVPVTSISPEQAQSISAFSASSRGATPMFLVHRPAHSWAGTRVALTFSPILEICGIRRLESITNHCQRQGEST